MYFLKNKITLEKCYLFFFTLFLFFSAIFCISTRVNNLFHISGVLFLIACGVSPMVRKKILQKKNLVIGLCTIGIFVIYFGISNLWGGNDETLRSAFTHGLYISIYTIILVTMLEDERYRHRALIAIISGLTVLAIYTLYKDGSIVMHTRAVSETNPGPTNVIDLAGYCGIGCLLTFILYTEKKQLVYLLPFIPLFTLMLLTQSRGPFIALMASVIILLHMRTMVRKHLIITAVSVLILAVILTSTQVGEQFFSRFEELRQQSGLRFSIWNHAIELAHSTLWFGKGFNYNLDFINYSGEHITTTHSIYIGAFLKGGIIGLALFLVIINYGLLCAWFKFINNRRLEASIFLFSIIFMMSQGMFIINNPRESWILFWLPLAVVISNTTFKRESLPVK